MAKKSKKQLQAELDRHGRDYELAKARGDKQGMEQAHAKANAVRKQAGWTYDSKRGYTVDGGRIVNGKESLALSKAGGNTVKAAKAVAQETPITRRYTPDTSTKKPKPKFTKPPETQESRSRPQIQTSNAFTAPPPTAQTQSHTPVRSVQRSNAFTAPPPIAQTVHPSPLTVPKTTVYEEHKRQEHLTTRAEQQRHDKAANFWEGWKPGDHVPNPKAYHAEQFALGAYKPIENTVMGLLQAPLDIVDKAGDVFGFGDTPFFKGTEDLARTLAVSRLQDDWEKSIEKRYQPTEQDKALSKWTQGAGNAAGIGAELYLTRGKSLPKLLQSILSNGIIGLSSYAGGTNQALMEGADYDAARKYGLLSGAAETLSERMFDGIPGMKTESVLTRAIDRLTKSAGARAALNIAGEGVEEMAVGAVDPMLRRWTYDPNAKNATMGEIMEQGLMGSVFAAGMQGASHIGSRVLTGRHSEKNHAYTAPKNQHIPDYEAQWKRYNQMGQNGIPFEQVVRYETATPIDYETAYSAHAAGYNDFMERTAQTAQRILAGEGAELVDIADAVVSPMGRQMLEEGFGFALSEHLPQAVAQAQTVANALQQKRQAQGVSDAVTMPQTEADVQEGQVLPLPPEATSSSERGTVTAAEVQTTPQQGTTAETAGRRSGGVVQNEAVRTVNKKTVKAVHGIAERLGVQVEFTSDMAEAGSYQNGTIRIGTKENDLNKTDRVIRQVFVHELTHTLEESGEYNALSQAILSEIDDAGALSEVREHLRERYAENGHTLDDTALDREVVAWFAEENLFTSERAIRGLAKKNRSLFQKVRDWLHGLRVKLRGTAEEKFVWQTEQLYRKALDAMESGKPGTLGGSENGQKKNAPSGTQYKFSDHKIPTYEELTAKPDIQVVDIRGSGVGRIAEQRKQFLNSPEAQQLYEAPVINRDTGEPVFITPHTLKHTFSNMGFEQINAGKHLKEIIENAVLTHVEEATHGSDNVTGVYTLFGAVQTEQGIQPVKLKVKEYIDDGRSLPQFIKQYFERNGKQDPYASAYDGRVLELESIEKEETSSSALTLTESNSVRGEHPSVSSIIRVADLYDLVNNEYQKYLPAKMTAETYDNAGHTEQLYRKALDAVESRKPGTLGGSENGQKKNAPSGMQYRIAKTTSGESFVDVGDTSLDGKDRNAILKALKQTIKQKFTPHITANGQEFQITGKTAKEWTWSQDAQRLYQKHTQVFYDKVNTFQNADELLEASGNYQSETLKHPRKDKFTSFGRGKVQFRVDGRGYQADIVVGITSSGEAVLYDIVNLKTKKITEAPNTGFISQGLPTTSRLGASAGNSIAQNHSGSNTQTPTVTQMQQNAIQEAGQDVGNVGQGNTQTGQEQGAHTQEQGEQGASQPETRHKVGGSESINDIIARNREQSDTIRKLKRQLRESGDGVLTDPKQVKGLVNSLLTDYSSRLGQEGKARITAEVQEIFDDIANNTTGSGEIHTRIRNVAREIIEHSAVLNTGTEQDYKALKAYLKNTKLTISEQDRADITDYNSFRRSLFGTIDLRNEGVPVDVAYMELTETFGEGLFPSDIAHPAEQLVHIKETMAALKPVFENPHSRNMGEATRLLADEIYERFFTLSEHPTRGRQQQRQLEAIRAQANERLREAVARERQKRDKAIDKIKARHSEMTWERKQRTEQNELRREITKAAGRLSTTLLKPTDTRHVVENGRQTENGQTVSMKKTVAALLETINLESQYSIDPETGRRIYTGETEGQLTQRTEKFRELRKMYEAVKDSVDSTMVVDPDLLYNLAQLEEMKGVKLGDYTTEQLYTLRNTIRAVESALASENKLFSQMRYKDIKSVGEGIIADNQTDKPRDSGRGTDAQGIAKVAQDTADFLEVEMLTPYHYFNQLGKSGRAIFAELSRARGQYIADTDWSLKYLEELKGEIDTSTWSGKHAELIPFQTASGQSGHMTREQRISLYLLSQRKQGLKHLTDKNGGITMREKGTETTERILLTKGDIERICAEMSAEERKIAKGLSVAMSHFEKWGNESSMKLYGYEKFGEKNYFPIRTDRNYRNTENENAAPGEKGYRIKNAGMTKSTDPGATNPIILENAFDVFGRHASEMAKYHAFAPVLTDIDRIYNYQQWDAGTRGTSVKTALENKLGKAGTRYWEQLVGDINSGIQRERTPFSGMFSNFKAAKVGANLRVVIQQPLSYIRAGHMIDAKYLMEGLSGKTDVEIMEKYAPIARWKALGYSEMDTGRQLSDMLRGKKETALEKVRAASMWAPGKADEITWKALWRAVEAETKATTELEPGTDAFYTAVGERFTEVIDRTQVVDTVLNRSGAMRNGGYGHQLGTMFMAEPTLDYNEIMANAKDVKAGKPGAVRQVVRCAKCMTVGAITKAFVCSLVDAGRDKDEDETWAQKFVQAFWGADGTEESMGEYISHVMSGNLVEGFNPMTWTPFLKDMVSLAQGYDRKSPDTALIADFYKSVQRLKDAANGEGKTALPAAAVQLLAKTADLSGLPLSNLEREVESMVNSLLLIPAVKDSAAGQQVQFTFRRFHTRLGADNIRDWVKWGNKNLTNEGMMRNFKEFLSKNELATEQDFRDADAGGRSKELSTLVNDWKDAMREGNTDEADSLAKQMDTLGYSKKKVQNRLSTAEQVLLKETWAVREKQSSHNVRITDKAKKTRQYRGMTLEQQEFFDARVRQYAGALALSEVDKSRKLEDFSTKWLAKARDAKTVGLTEDQFLIMWTVTKDIEPMKTKDGKSIPNSRGLRIMQQIYKTFPGLTEKQYAYLFDGRNVPAKAMYTGSSKKHINNPARTEQELRKLQKKEGK